MEKILLGLGLNDEILNSVISNIAGFGVEIAERTKADNKRTKESVTKALVESGCGYTVCIVQQALQRSNPFSVVDFDYIRTENEKTLLIPILADELKGTDYMQRLEAVGITGALFEKDASMDNIATVIQEGGRARKVCKLYYGIDSSEIKQAAAAIQTVDPQALLKFLNDTNNDKSAVERAKQISDTVSSDMFSILISQVDDAVKEELVAAGGYELYFPLEAMQFNAEIASTKTNKQKKENKTKVVEKEVVKIVEKEVVKEVIKHDVKFVDVSDVIGVIGLSAESGSTLIALNLARELALQKLQPTLIQLPNTNSDLYSSLHFQEVFGPEYNSCISAIAQGMSCESKRNDYFDINFCVPNPYTDMWIDDMWGNEETYKLLLSVPSPKIVDFGSYFEADGSIDLLPCLKHLIVVIDSNMVVSEDDFRFVRDLGRMNSDMDISFAVNRCKGEIPQDLNKFIGDGKILKLPLIENSVLEESGSDIIVPGYGSGFEKLSEMAGYEVTQVFQEEIKKLEPPTKKKRKARASQEKVHAKANMVSVEIGVGGTCRGVGTTHTALMFAYMLSSKYKVAVVEQNCPYDNAHNGQEHAFANIYRHMNPDTYVNSNVIPKFTYKGIDFFPYCNYTQFSARFRDDYDFVVVDFGNEMNDANFFRMGKRLVVASVADWKLAGLKRYVNEVALKNNMENSINYLIPFIPAAKLGEVRKICSVGGCIPNVYSIPFCPDWDEPTPEIEIIFNDIVNNNQQRKKKTMFGLFRK